MLDKHSIELINAGVDGELDSEQLKVLDDLLSSSSEARELHGEMLRLSNFLDALPDQPPPPELARQILAKIHLPRKSVVFSLRNMFASFQPLAVATAFAAGLMLSIGFYELAPRQFSTADLDTMVGTAVMKKSTGKVISGYQSDSLVLDEKWLSGTVSLQQTQGLFVLNFDLDSAAQVEIGLVLQEAGLAFAGIAREAGQQGSVNEEFKVSGGTLRMGNQGRQSFVIFLRNTANQDSGKDINIEFSSGNERVVKGLSSTS
jgi:hypothetical protein